jgi:hypothetical protein
MPHCPICDRPTDAVEGLCPRCGSALPRGEPASPAADAPVAAVPEHTDPDAAALPEVTDPQGTALPEPSDSSELPDPMDAPVDTDPDAKIPPEIFDGEDTDPGAAPTHEPDPEAAPPAETETRRRLPGMPWGKLVVVVVYLVVGGGILLYEHHASEAARIARHLRAADRLLGERGGAGASVEELLQAAEHYLEALTLDLHLDLAQRRLDVIKRRLEERRSPMPDEMSRRHAAISARAQMERAQARSGFWSQLPITPRERFGLDDHEAKMRRNRYFYLGGFTILLGWMIIRGSWRGLSGRETRGPMGDPDDDPIHR